jgi:DNA transposition AAA+ family ATPase
VSRSPSLCRRAILTFAGVGLDIRPAARRVRDAMLRSHRTETARLFARVEKTQFHLQVEVAALRGLLQAEVAALHDRCELLEQAVAAAKAESGVLAEADASVADMAVKAIRRSATG